MKQNKLKYIVLIGGLLATILLTIGLIVLNKEVFSTQAFKDLTNSSNLKLIINNLIGFGEIIVVILTFITFLIFNNNKNEKWEKKSLIFYV